MAPVFNQKHEENNPPTSVSIRYRKASKSVAQDLWSLGRKRSLRSRRETPLCLPPLAPMAVFAATLQGERPT